MTKDFAKLKYYRKVEYAAPSMWHIGVWKFFELGNFVSNLSHPPPFLDSCPTWTIVAHGQLLRLDSCVLGQLSPGQLSGWTDVTWTGQLSVHPFLWVRSSSF